MNSFVCTWMKLYSADCDACSFQCCSTNLMSSVFDFSHKNVAIRKVAAQCLVVVVERMGPGRILSGVKDTTDRVLPAVANLSCDANPHVR